MNQNICYISWLIFDYHFFFALFQRCNQHTFIDLVLDLTKEQAKCRCLYKIWQTLILSFTHCCNSSVTEYIINTNINNFPIVSDMTSLPSIIFCFSELIMIFTFFSLSSIDCLLVVKIFFSIIIFCCYYLERDQERRGISYNCMMIIILASIDDATSHMMEKIGISLRNQTFLFFVFI